MTRRSFGAGLVFLSVMARPGMGTEVSGPPFLRPRAEEQVDLAGRWILTMPSGAQWNATFERTCRCGHIQLRCGADMLQGEYDLNGMRLTVTKPKDERMTGLVWRVRNKNLLELVEHPVSSQFGAGYLGAILVRRINEDRAGGNER